LLPTAYIWRAIKAVETDNLCWKTAALQFTQNQADKSYLAQYQEFQK
jgi:hypothetical protein